MSKEDKYLGIPTIQERRATVQDSRHKGRRRRDTRGPFVVLEYRGLIGMRVWAYVETEQASQRHLICRPPTRYHFGPQFIHGLGEGLSRKEARLIARGLELAAGEA